MTLIENTKSYREYIHAGRIILIERVKGGWSFSGEIYKTIRELENAMTFERETTINAKEVKICEWILEACK